MTGKGQERAPDEALDAGIDAGIAPPCSKSARRLRALWYEQRWFGVGIAYEMDV